MLVRLERLWRIGSDFSLSIAEVGKRIKIKEAPRVDERSVKERREDEREEKNRSTWLAARAAGRI